MSTWRSTSVGSRARDDCLWPAELLLLVVVVLLLLLVVAELLLLVEPVAAEPAVVE